LVLELRRPGERVADVVQLLHGVLRFYRVNVGVHLVDDLMDACTDVVQDHVAGQLLSAGDDGAQRAVPRVQLVLVQCNAGVACELVEEVVQAEVHPEQGRQYPAEGDAPVAECFLLSESCNGLYISHRIVASYGCLKMKMRILTLSTVFAALEASQLQSGKDRLKNQF
jgi:hypothetical protein